MPISDYYPVLSTLNFIAALLGVYYGSRLFLSTRGATDFWLFLSAFAVVFALISAIYAKKMFDQLLGE